MVAVEVWLAELRMVSEKRGKKKLDLLGLRGTKDILVDACPTVVLLKEMSIEREHNGGNETQGNNH
jgi:hypothetical protein